MGQVIWKFALQPYPVFEITLPKGSKILTVQLQNGKPVLWAIVEETAEPEPVTIVTWGTGHKLIFDKELLQYINTYQLRDGAEICHVFRYTGDRSIS